MTALVVFPDPEALLVAYLGGVLAVPVATKVPNPRPASFVRLARIGGNRRDLVTDMPVLVVECWAASEPDASDLATLARAHVAALAQETVNGAYVRSVEEVGGPVPFPDPVSGSPRYQFTVRLSLKGSAL